MTFVMAVVAILGFAGLALPLQIGVRALVVSGGAFLAAAGITVAVLLAKRPEPAQRCPVRCPCR
jgi:heme/copper-type cytochrome/quinol oxidase subunit 1